MAGIVVADSVTALPPATGGAVLVAGSHGGVYAAYLAARAQVRAVLLNDASGGKDDAGIAGLAYLDALGVPAATASHASARIADGADSVARGVVSHVNASASALGCVAGRRVSDVARLLDARAPRRSYTVPPHAETRHAVEGPWPAGLRVVALDSISLVDARDAGAIVLVGSHGALFGGRDDGAPAGIAAFGCNDAGIGRDDAGVARLAALDSRGVPAFAVAAASARIGDGRSTYADGVVSRANGAARARGVRIGATAREVVARLAAALASPTPAT